MRYLDPKNDLVFKKVFSRPRLLKSFLNALLPLEYLPVELVLDLPELKHSESSWSYLSFVRKPSPATGCASCGCGF